MQRAVTKQARNLGWVGRFAGIARGRQGPSRWVLALSLLGAALLARLGLGHWLAPVPFFTFVPAVVASALLCGWLPASVVLVLSAVAAWSLFIPPAHSEPVTPENAKVWLLGFLIAGGLQIALITTLAEVIRRLEKATRLQEVLFRELQHRVANNLQVVAGTLHHARRTVQNDAALESLDQAEARIISMAQLHRRVYDVSTYNQGLEPILRDMLAETFRGLPVDVRVNTHSDGLSTGAMTAILLLVNEAALNAAKHVFRPSRGTLFDVSLSKLTNGRLRLVVRDDGPGIPRDQVSDRQPQTLGMSIMRTFATQLGGCLEALPGQGTALCVEFAPQ
jgi:two-component system, sensor histidine kinase PdtaS